MSVSLRHALAPFRRVPRARRLLAITLLAASAVVLGAVGTLGGSRAARAFEALNAAQTLLYDRAHLAGTSAGDELVYRYAARVGDAPTLDDRATLLVDAAPEPERRDVTLDFLSGERRLELPPFEGYRGNPVLIAMLEHVARSLAASAGGGALYVRNRIRDALAGAGSTIEDGSAAHGGREIRTVTLAFDPFANDPYLGARAGYGDATISIVFSDDVAGGVLEIAARSGERADTPFDYALRLDDNPEAKR